METKYQFYLKRNKYQILFKNNNSIYRSVLLRLPAAVNRPAINSSSLTQIFLSPSRGHISPRRAAEIFHRR
jgi:hypothetical protein